MCWLRTSIKNGGWSAVGVLLTVVALTIGLAGLSAPPASAYGPGANPTLQVVVTEGPGQIQGFAWTEDATVTITRTRASVDVVLGTVPTGTPYPGWFQFPTGNGELQVGDLVTVTGNTSSYSRVLQVIALDITHVDVPGATLSGTKGSDAAGWGTLSVGLGNMFSGMMTQVVVPANASTTWSAVLPAADFELMEGVGASVWQTDPDGDMLQVGRSVPNPTVQIDDHGASMQGWMANSPLDVYLDNDPGDATPYPYHYQVTTNGDGGFCCQPAPDQEWQVVQPGWRVKVVGSYPSRDDGTVTKEATYVALPIPTLVGNVLSGQVPGTLTATTVGSGSLVDTSGICPSVGQPGVNRTAYATAGTFTVDFGAAVVQPWGWGGPCTDAVFYYGVRARDLDGDVVQVNWFAEPQPALTADLPVMDGGELTVEGSGWDLTTIRVEQCELLGDVVGECDPETAFLKLSSPDFSGWPATMAQFGENTTAKQVLDLSGGRQVDCAESDGACAVVATEVYRPDVTAFVPLVYEQPYWVDLEVTVAPTGTVSSVSGTATIRGTITATDTVWVHLTGELRQRLGRKVVAGWVDTWRFVDEPGVPTAFEVQVLPYNSLAFGSGSAEMSAWVDLGDEGPTDGASTLQVVKLTMLRPPKPPRR